MKKLEVKQGDTFGRLTIIKELEPHVYPSGNRRRIFLASCSCGSDPKSYRINELRNGHTKSCGCYNAERITSHGMNDTRVYQCWADMKTRCDNPKNKFYDYYGGRGITYCDKWKTFEGFWEDMQDGYSEDLTLNRRDNDGMYCKENCQWDTKHFQGHMRRKKSGTKLDSIGTVYDESNMNYRVRMKINEKPVTFGTYLTEEEAAKAYDDASEMYYGDRPNKTEKNADHILEKVKWYMENKDVDLRAKSQTNPASKLTAEQVLEMVKLYQSGILQKHLSKQFGVNQSTVSSICRGDSWTDVTGIVKNK